MVQALRKTVWLFLKVKCTLTIGPTIVILQLLLWVKKKSCLDLVIPTMLTSTCCCSHSSPGMGLLPPITAGQSPEGLHSLSFFSALHTAAFSFIFFAALTSFGFVASCSSGVYQFSLCSSSTSSQCFSLSGCLLTASRFSSTCTGSKDPFMTPQLRFQP